MRPANYLPSSTRRLSPWSHGWQRMWPCKLWSLAFVAFDGDVRAPRSNTGRTRELQGIRGPPHDSGMLSAPAAAAAAPTPMTACVTRSDAAWLPPGNITWIQCAGERLRWQRCSGVQMELGARRSEVTQSDVRSRCCYFHRRGLCSRSSEKRRKKERKARNRTVAARRGLGIWVRRERPE